MPSVTITVVYIIFYFILHADCQDITLCSNPVKNNPCTITCTTADFSKDVVFYLGTTDKGSCLVSLSICTGVTQTGNVTSLAISSLSKTAHEGTWTCSYGSVQSSPQSLVVYTEPTVTTFINESSTPPDERKKIKEVNLAARSYCFFPPVSSANLFYKGSTSSQLTKLSENSVVGVSGTSLGCETYEQDLQVNITVNIDNDQYKVLAGKTVYFQITFTNALGTTYRTNDLGPYAFEDDQACTGSFHCGFWPVLLIVVVACVIIWILVWKKDLKIGGFCQRKEINIAILIGVPIILAIVIGVILGIVMKCIICVTAVGVSIGVGLFIVVVLLIFIIVWNCKKEFYRAVINITSVSYTDDLGDCKSEAYKNLSHRVIKAIEFLYKNVEGQQTVMEINFSPGLMVTFDLSSQGFSDCSVLSDTLKNALQKGDISSFNVSSVGFEFMPLQDWKDSKGETSDRSNGDRARSPASASAVKVEAE